ncbi:MAG: DUF4198 domain-containing protein [Nitratireductor sp.]
MLTTNFFKKILYISSALTLIHIPIQAIAHEYWIEPEQFEYKTGENLKADLKNGEDFQGYSYSYIKDSTKIYSITSQSTTITPNQRTGNRPAFNYKIKDQGLHIASFQNRFDRITFKSFEKFETYASAQGLDGIVERHEKRGLSKEEIVEEYARSAKALVQVGDLESNSNTQNADQLTGLTYEFVVDKNPYSLSQNDALPLTLFYEGKPMANKQIKVFRESLLEENDVEIFKLRTDENGKAKISLQGGGKFLLSSVHMIEGDDDPTTKIGEWQSYWASLVFGIKGSQERASKLSKMLSDK